MVSLVDVARRANVSLTTASRVLSSSQHPVSEEKRARVLQAAQELNYTPSALAQAMVTGDTRIIGVIVGDAADPYFASIVRGIEDVARSHQYLVIVCNSDRDPEVELTYLHTLYGYRVDGVIFAGGGLNDPEYLQGMDFILNNFRARGTVCVSLGRHLFPNYSVAVDFKKLAQEAVEYLIGLGHTRVAYIAGPKLLTTTEDRTAGFLDALASHSIPIKSVYLLDGDFRYQSGQLAAEKIIALQDRPSAVVASNDLMAVGCISRLREYGLRIPEDVSVVGIDDIPFASFIDPPLTTISIPLYDMGRLGMESLLQIRKGALPEQGEVILPHRLIVRRSTAIFKG
jgi:LacI family transcriptional regulator